MPNFNSLADQVKEGSVVVEKMALFSDFLDNVDFNDLHDVDQRRMQSLVRELQTQLKKFEYLQGEIVEEPVRLREYKDLI